ncbi:hypothetical protein ACLB2K_023342 [Fragaria x ananassa]
MARAADLICLMFVWSLWSAACNGATNTLKPGDSLVSDSSLVSASGKFTMNFRVYDHEANLSYLVIKYNASHNYAWVGNRETPILYPFGVLTLDRNNTLKITHRDGDAVVLYSAESGTVSGDVVATLTDDGNFVLQELSSDGSVKRVLWQSFDYPGDVLLPGMKLGVNRSNGHNWSLSCWLTERSAVPGPFTLDWDPDGKQLKIKRRGVVYWSSGVFRDGNFENIKHKRYNFSIVSKENENYFSYSAVDEDAISEWLLTTIGRLKDFDGLLDIAKADDCYGYNTEEGCQIWDQPTKCGRFGNIFEQENGYFNPADSSGSPTTSTTDPNTSLSISDCKAACWADCNCCGFIFLNANQTGCRYWIGNLKFVPDSTGYSSQIVYFLTTMSADSSSHKWIWIGTAIGTSVFLMVFCIICCLLRRRKLSLFGKNKAKIDEKDLLDLRGYDISTDAHGIQNDGSMGHDLRAFSYESVTAATDYFSFQNKLGEGGFGPVYKGKLASGREVAIKRLSRGSVQGISEFKNELILISELQHTNLVQLLGYCIHGVERMLVYEYLPNKSLDYILFDSTRGMLLDWNRRFNIIEGIAQGLLYLHKYSRLKVIHRDLKASNILLDEDMNPKISDFGMARIFTVNEVEANTNRIVGTYGYMSPEYAMEGIFSGKSDVFSFGVLMLEIISGRRNNSFHNAHRALNLVGYTWELWKEGAGLDLMDPRLSAIKYNESHNYAWIANREDLVEYPSGVLTLEKNNTLHITRGDDDPVLLYSPDSETINGDVVAVLNDDGNFVVQEVSSKRVLWQSFDYPGDVLLPGMKLGVNRGKGQDWSLSSWLSEKAAVPGPFTLGWDGSQLIIKRRGMVYWTSGVLRDGKFENIKQKKYSYKTVSNENEFSFTYLAADQKATPQWLLTTMGRLQDSDGGDIAKADSCYGYNNKEGCRTWDQPTDCNRTGDIFQQYNGYFNDGGSRTDYPNASLRLSDCKANCWADCQCKGFSFFYTNQTGCKIWSGDVEFSRDSASSNLVYYLEEQEPDETSASDWIWIGVSIGVSVLLVVVCIICCILRSRKLFIFRKNKEKIDEKELLDSRGSDISTDIHGIQNDGSTGHDLRAFSYESVKAATDFFSEENKLGEGGFGPVYKETLSSGREVAIKSLARGSLQGTLEFKNELELISELQHTNLVQLLGYCSSWDIAFMVQKGYSEGILLDWKTRFNIIEGIAQGLLYLHKFSRLKVIHRDLKASNILLDQDMNPKISDFGLARIFHSEGQANTNRIVGTYGYMSLEYAMHGIFSGKTDVFSFGVLMLEIISGRTNNSFHHRAITLVGYSWELWKEGKGLDVMDPRLSDSCNGDQLLRCMHVGLLCVEEDVGHRPTMQDCISMLTNESFPLPAPTKPACVPVSWPEGDESESKSVYS